MNTYQITFHGRRKGAKTMSYSITEGVKNER